MDNTDFDHKRIAQGYKERPFLHEQAIQRFRKDVTDRSFSNGLDVGCGAGLSLKALRSIATHVTGADISPEMIEAARESCGDAQDVKLIVSKAEEIPAAEEKYDIVTAAGVIQWVDRERFLSNLRGIIADDGHVLIYDHGISDRMCGNAAYTDWWNEEYLKEFPRPYRDESVWTDAQVREHGFAMQGQVRYEMGWEFGMDAFIRFMMIQSNVNARIESGQKDAGEVREWFEKTLEPIFHQERRTLIFTGYSWYMATV